MSALSGNVVDTDETLFLDVNRPNYKNVLFPTIS